MCIRDSLYGSLKGTTAVMFSNTANVPAKLIKDKAKDGIPGLKAAYAEESFYVGADQLDCLLYTSTGIRLSELIGLDDKDVDFSAFLLKVTGKRNKMCIRDSPRDDA